MKLFDIETGPQPEDQIAIPEFEAGKNLKDPAKIAADIAKKKAKFLSDAALSPISGKIVSFAVCDSGDISSFKSYGAVDTDEGHMIMDLLRLFQDSCRGSCYKLGGWNIKEFDLPFVIRRAWALGVEVPSSIIPDGIKRFYWPPHFVELRDIWGLGQFQPKGSLDDVASLLGVARKTGSGKDFAKLYSDPETRDQAIEYQRREMEICCAMCERFGL